MFRKLPPLSALQPFEATARLGSVSAAAAELGRTHGAISKQIGSLSEDLGGDLFQKQGTGLRLTARGERLARMLHPFLNELDAISGAMRAEVDDQQVLIAMSSTLATRWFVPRLPRFLAKNPTADIRLFMSGAAGVSEHEVDMVLSYDRLRGAMRRSDPNILGDVAFGLVCAPGHPIEEEAGAVRATHLLTQPNAQEAWAAYGDLMGRRIDAEHQIEYPHHILALEAAAAGLGVALAEARLVENDLASGRLIAPFGFITIEDGFQAAITSRGKDRRSVRKALNWMEEEARAKFQPPPPPQS